MSDEHPAGILRVRELYRVGWKILRAARWHLLVLTALLIIPGALIDTALFDAFDVNPDDISDTRFDMLASTGGFLLTQLAIIYVTLLTAAYLRTDAYSAETDGRAATAADNAMTEPGMTDNGMMDNGREGTGLPRRDILRMAEDAEHAGVPVFSRLMTRALRKYLPVLLAGIIGGILFLLGLVLLIVPGIIVIVWLAFYSEFIVLEDDGPLRSLASSRLLVKWHFWDVLNPALALMLPWLVLEYVIGFMFEPVTARFLASVTSGVGMLFATIAWTALFLNVRLMWKIPPEPKKGLMNREIGG